MRSFRPIARVIAALTLCAGPPLATAGVLDTPLPKFSDAKPALRVAIIPGVVKNNNLETAVVCTSLAVGPVDIGLETFDQTGARANTIALGNGALLGIAPGATITIATNNTAVLHEDTVITLEAPVTSLRNGSARIVATSLQVGCVALSLDAKHAIDDPLTCPTCEPPVIASRPLDQAAGGSTTTTVTSTTLVPTTSTTLLSLCTATPRSGCLTTTQPAKARLVLKSGLTEVLAWKWALGAATTIADYASPTTTTQYALCLYDGVSGIQTLVAEADLPGGGLCGARPCWTALPNGLGFKYGNTLGAPHGLTKATLRVGSAGKAKIAVKGKGSLLPVPPLPLKASPNVTVQLVHGPGTCWAATYSAPQSNTTTLFKAASD